MTSTTEPSARSYERAAKLHFGAPDGSHLAALEVIHPREIVQWAADNIDDLAVTTSFQSSGLVILHLMKQVRPDVPVLFLDTGFHFAETLEFRDRIAKSWGINVVELRGEHGSPKRQAEIYGPGLYRRNPDLCCTINKVQPLQHALAGYHGWLSGLRRDQSASRAAIPIVEVQTILSGEEILKINPLAHWSKEDVEAYVREHEIPTHPLLEKGYASIGCWPCTRPVASGEDERAGRWEGFEKSECGIHTSPQRPA